MLEYIKSVIQQYLDSQRAQATSQWQIALEIANLARVLEGRKRS